MDKDNMDIKILSNLDLYKNDVSNAHHITGDNSSIYFNENNLSLKTKEDSYVNVNENSIEQSSDSISLSANDSSVNMSSKTIDIKSDTITMSHPNNNTGIQFNWDSENNTLIIGKKNL